MCEISHKKHIAVILCALLILLSVPATCSEICPDSKGICYIMPVYTNVYRFAEYNKQALENDSESDIQWIKENADIYRQPVQERLVPLLTAIGDVAIYSAVIQSNMRNNSYKKGRIYHMLN